MGLTNAAVAAIAGLVFAVAPAYGFYLPGVAPQDYARVSERGRCRVGRAHKRDRVAFRSGEPAMPANPESPRRARRTIS